MYSEVTLLFNGNCMKCKTLAGQINTVSKQRISVVPLASKNAEDMLRNFYPKGHPIDFFLIRRKNGRAVCVRGFRAALGLGRLLPLGGTLKVLQTYLHFEAHADNLTARFVHPKGEIEKEAQSLRRDFVRTSIVGGMALMLAAVGLGSVPIVQAHSQSSKIIHLAAGQANGKSFTIQLPEEDCPVLCPICGGVGHCYCCVGTTCYECCQETCALSCQPVGNCTSNSPCSCQPGAYVCCPNSSCSCVG